MGEAIRHMKQIPSGPFVFRADPVSRHQQNAGAEADVPLEEKPNMASNTSSQTWPKLPAGAPRLSLCAIGAILASMGLGAGAMPEPQPGLLKKSFIFEQAVFATNHASTLVETKKGLLAAWVSGPKERHPSNNIFSARYDGKTWSAPGKIVDGSQAERHTRYPCWNPVLFQPTRGPLLLFYKVGPSPEAWWGMLTTSTNDGSTWSKPVRLPEGIVGPVRNKPLELSDGSLLCGASTENNGWVVHMERCFGRGERWQKSGPLNDSKRLPAIQPTILPYGNKVLQILCRTKQGFIAESWSRDEGKTWESLKPTKLPNPNTAIDAVRLHDGRWLLVYNHSATERNVLNVALSNNGTLWQPTLVLEKAAGEFSYPAVIQSRDGLVHILYSWNRQRIAHVVVDPTKVATGSLPIP
jgi:predicted neuraminidase